MLGGEIVLQPEGLIATPTAADVAAPPKYTLRLAWAARAIAKVAVTPFRS